MKTICEKATLLKRLVVALLLVLSADAFAYDVEVDSIYYNLDYNGMTCEVTYLYCWNNNNADTYKGDSE